MENSKKCSCCSGNAREVLLGANAGQPGGLSRKDFLKTLASGALGLSVLSSSAVGAAADSQEGLSIIKGEKGDLMVVDKNAREMRISATVTKDVSKPSVADWGRRFQAFFGVWGGKMEAYFVFTTGVSRTEIDKAIRELGVTSRRQLPMEEVDKRKGLKPTTTREDYLDGDPVIVTVRFVKDGKLVEGAMEDFIREKIIVEGKEVEKPYTPHFVYHGTGEAIHFPSGCIVCPSDCNGGIITDNVLPLKTTENYYLVDWDRMPPVDSKVEVVLKSIYGPGAFSSVKS
jgi:hypothetical protein